MKPMLNMALCLIGIAAMMLAGMPLFNGKHAVTVESLNQMVQSGVPLEAVEKIRVSMGGEEFLYGFTMDSRLIQVLGKETAAKHRARVLEATRTGLAVKDFGKIFSLFFLAFAFWAWAYKQPLAGT